MRLLGAAGLLGLVVLSLGAGPATALPIGGYTLVDGPRAGQDFQVSAGGHGSILDIPSNITAVDADDDCDQPHLHGTINGKSQPTGPCGWGRILRLISATPVLRATTNAITEEERAIDRLSEHPPSGHWELVLYGQIGLENAKEELEKAKDAFRIDSATATKIRRRLDAAHEIDVRVKKRLQEAGRHPSATVAANSIRDLRNALSLKREALTMEEHAGLKIAASADVPSPGTPRLLALATGTVTVFWDVNVPLRVKSALCVATSGGVKTNHSHPLFAGTNQVQRCKVTNRTRIVGGHRKRVVHFEITVTGTATGPAKRVQVKVYWPV